VWVLVTSGSGGKDPWVGVYDSPEAVLEDLGKMPNMTAELGEDGVIRGQPVEQLRPGRWPGHWRPVRWAEARPQTVRRPILLRRVPR